jgi:hypothetical protein
VKIEKREIAVLIITLVIVITANAWWRVKETGRRARVIAAQEAAQREAGADADADAETDGGAE